MWTSKADKTTPAHCDPRGPTALDAFTCDGFPTAVVSCWALPAGPQVYSLPTFPILLLLICDTRRPQVTHLLKLRLKKTTQALS